MTPCSSISARLWGITNFSIKAMVKTRSIHKTFKKFSTKRDYTLKVTQAHENYFAKTKAPLGVISNQSTLSPYTILYAGLKCN